MDPIEEIRKLIILDPKGWKMSYDNQGRLTHATHGDVSIAVGYRFNGYGSEIKIVRIFPGAYDLGWWQRRRLLKLIPLFSAVTARSISAKIAERVLKEREAEISKELKDLDDMLSPNLVAEFAKLEADARREQTKATESPVTHGFFKGAFKRLGGK
jgi:hypothetical protein